MVLPALASAARAGAQAAGKGAKSAAKKGVNATKKSSDIKKGKTANRSHPSTTEVGKKKADQTDKYAQEYTNQKRASFERQVKSNNKSKKRLSRRHESGFTKTKFKQFTNQEGILELADDAKLKVRSIDISLKASLWVMLPYWLMVQIPLYLLFLVSFLSAVVLASPKAIMDSTGSLGVALDVTTFILNTVPALGLMTKLATEFFDFGSGMFFGLALGIHFLIALLSWLLMGAMAGVYTANGIDWWGGKGSALKSGSLIFAYIGYASIFFNFLPFILIWMLVVALIPE